MRQPTYVPDQEQLFKDFHGGELDDVAPDAVAITVDEYLNPQETQNRRDSPADDEVLSLVCAVRSTADKQPACLPHEIRIKIRYCIKLKQVLSVTFSMSSVAKMC